MNIELSKGRKGKGERAAISSNRGDRVGGGFTIHGGDHPTGEKEEKDFMALSILLPRAKKEKKPHGKKETCLFLEEKGKKGRGTSPRTARSKKGGAGGS